MAGKRTVNEVLDEFGPAARMAWADRFETAGLNYPPPRIDLVAIKKDRDLEVWARKGSKPVLIHAYPVLAASGQLGPKLREGDLQVPEGVYTIEGLNPNSAFHLSMKVSYPNAFDRERAAEDGRVDLGGDIFIHGKQASIGCLAMGDAAIEELFVLVADVGSTNIRVLISPVDFRAGDSVDPRGQPAWVPDLYSTIETSLREFQ